MAFTVKYHPDVRDVDLPLNNRKMRDRNRRAIESRLMAAPHEYGLPLRKNLGGYWILRVGNHRVVFKIEGKIVYILGIRHRKDVYGELTRISHQASTAAADTGMSTALRSVGLLDVLYSTSPGPLVARLVSTPVSTASRRTLVRNAG